MSTITLKDGTESMLSPGPQGNGRPSGSPLQ